MKLNNSLVVGFMLLSASLAGAATTAYTFATGTTATSSGIANSAGVAFQNSANAAFAGPGTIAWGYFTISDAAISSANQASTLISAFQNWNLAGTSVFASPGPGATSNRGTFTFNPSARDLTTIGGDAFANKNMYVFVGNGNSFAASTEFLVLKTNFTFDPAESGVSLFAKTINTGNSTVLIGNQVANVFTTGGDTSQTPGWNTVALVPEPSVALLGALGIFGLVRRRR